MIVDQVKFKRGTTAAVLALTPAEGEPLYDKTIKQIRVGDGSTAGGKKVAMEDVGIDRTLLFNAFAYPAPATEWTPAVAGAHLGNGQTAKVVYLLLAGLQLGDIIKSYKLMGDATIAGTSTLDCKLVRVNKAHPLTTTDITSGAIVQITTGGAFAAAANPDDETVATEKQYLLQITGTTDAADAFDVMGAEVLVTRLP